uniref:Late endosomal/lysosomal adaptor, MAPK and MTOR activator 1 n=1 Tax=Leptobrachium leishanense TaxID=445787 RepID=A0A8C5QME3_9ANUR
SYPESTQSGSARLCSTRAILKARGAALPRNGSACWSHPCVSLSCSMRLTKLSNNLTHWKKLPPLPTLTAQPHQILASDLVPYADVQQVSKIAAYAFSALSQIRVDAKEELVVQFGIP